MLRVTSVHHAMQAQCIVSIDPNVPISFRSFSQPMAGARYIRLGNFKTQLLELQFPPESLVLTGFTLVAGEASTSGTLSGNGASRAGLPVMDLSAGEIFSGTGPISRLDIQTNVTLSRADDRAEIRLGSAKTFDRRIVHGNVQFLLSEDVLVGLRVVDLDEKERQILDEYIAHHPNEEESLRG